MKRKLLFITSCSIFLLFAAALNAEAHGPRFSFGFGVGFGFGFGVGHYGMHTYYPGPLYRPYAYRGPYYRAIYPAPVVTYYSAPYRYRVYRPVALRYRQHERAYSNYEPRRYYRRW